MKQFKMNRTTVAAALCVLVLGGASIAAAETASGSRAEKQCEGEEGASTPAEREQRQAERFQKADKNGDGFLTQDEIGDKRWEHMKVADANNDGKLSKAEIEQAHKDGKLGHHHRS
jgi:Ca2+-binding EF-hand superfamily protein